MGGRVASSGSLGQVGESSPNGQMKTVTLYHGSYYDFDKFKSGAVDKNQVNQYGEGFYFTDDPMIARNYGDIVYTVEVKYSTDRRTAKKTGREQDFSYNKQTGFWVIPTNKAQNLKIKKKRRVD